MLSLRPEEIEMRARKILLAIVCLVTLTGCRASDALFSVFGDYYSDGISRDDKYARYNARIEQTQQPGR